MINPLHAETGKTSWSNVSHIGTWNRGGLQGQPCLQAEWEEFVQAFDSLWFFLKAQRGFIFNLWGYISCSSCVCMSVCKFPSIILTLVVWMFALRRQQLFQEVNTHPTEWNPGEWKGSSEFCRVGGISLAYKTNFNCAKPSAHCIWEMQQLHIKLLWITAVGMGQKWKQICDILFCTLSAIPCHQGLQLRCVQHRWRGQDFADRHDCPLIFLARQLFETTAVTHWHWPLNILIEMVCFYARKYNPSPSLIWLRHSLTLLF